MLYCFIEEDRVNVNDPLFIQKEYAAHLGCLCVCNLSKKSIVDHIGRPIDVYNKDILLRCSYDKMEHGFQLLRRYEANLIENSNDVTHIESWYKLNLSIREIEEVNLISLERNKRYDGINRILSNDLVFIKSKKKGFSAIVRSEGITNDEKTIRFLREQCKKYGEQLVISPYRALKTDSLGTRESRHIVMNGQLINSSRFVHSVRHTVPKSHQIKAQEVISKLKSLTWFPRNYVIDIGEFIYNDDEIVTDTVEINPLSCSMCYVNNSVFTTQSPDIGNIHSGLQIGYEYCFDALRNPCRYEMNRDSNTDYTYSTDEKYCL